MRILCDEFPPGRTQKKLFARNDDSSAIGPARADSSSSALFRAYLDSRHYDGGMADMAMLDYAMMIEDSHVESRMAPIACAAPDGPGPLVACCLTDVLDDGLSMVYSFYDPGSPRRSLGAYMILDHIEKARALGLPTSISAIGSRAQEDGLQGAIPAAGAPRPRRLDAGGLTAELQTVGARLTTARKGEVQPVTVPRPQRLSRRPSRTEQTFPIAQLTGAHDGVDGLSSTASLCQGVVAGAPQRGRPSMKKFIKIGVDLAKNYFQVHALESENGPAVTRKLKRSKMHEFF